MTVDELLAEAPVALAELTEELLRRGHESMLADDKSQPTACLLIALRAASLLHGMASVLKPDTLDSFDTLTRAHIETRDLLQTFRFDDQGARDKIGYWFVGAKDNAWKADHSKCDEFLTRLGANGLQSSTNWSKLSVFSHPTKYAAENSAVVIVSRVTGKSQTEVFAYKKADYVVSISRLIFAVTYDLPGWISLSCNENLMPHVEGFRALAEQVALPILNTPINHGLPESSIQSPKKKVAI